MRSVPYFDGSTNYVDVPIYLNTSNGCSLEITFTYNKALTGYHSFCVWNTNSNSYVQISNTGYLQWEFAGSSLMGTTLVNSGLNTVSFTWDGKANSNKVLIYLNGRLEATANDTSAGGLSPTTMRIGAYTGTPNHWAKGLLYEVRIWGYQRTQREIQRDMYRRLTGYEPGLIAYYPLDEPSGTIAYDRAIPTYTKSLLDCSGGVLTDKCKRIWTANGGATVSNAQSKFVQEGYSLYFDGTKYWTTPYSPDFSFGTGDFTIDFWSYVTTNSANQRILKQANTDAGFQIYVSSDGTVYFNPYGGEITAGISTQNQWVHFVFARQNGTLYALRQGQLINTVGYATSLTSTAELVLGANNDYTYKFNGHLSQPRITKGKALWTSNFTPPTAPGQIEYQTSFTPNNGTYNGTFSRVQMPEIDRYHQQYSYGMEG